MDIKVALGILAGVVNLIGYVPYIRDILRGKVRPQRITWGIWTILTSIAAVNQIVNGGGWSSVFFVSTSLLVVVTFLLSIKYGVGGIGRLDVTCLSLALLLLAYWVMARDTTYSTYIAVLIDGIGALPTIIKTYKAPHTESYPQWVLAAIAGLITMFAVERYEFVLVAYPLYIFIFNSIIVCIKYYSERHTARPHSSNEV